MLLNWLTQLATQDIRKTCENAFHQKFKKCEVLSVQIVQVEPGLQSCKPGRRCGTCENVIRHAFETFTVLPSFASTKRKITFPLEHCVIVSVKSFTGNNEKSELQKRYAATHVSAPVERLRQHSRTNSCSRL